MVRFQDASVMLEVGCISFQVLLYVVFGRAEAQVFGYCAVNGTALDGQIAPSPDLCSLLPSMPAPNLGHSRALPIKGSDCPPSTLSTNNLHSVPPPTTFTQFHQHISLLPF